MRHFSILSTLALLSSVPATLCAQELFDLSTGYDQEAGLTIAEGALDDDYRVLDPFDFESDPIVLVSDGFPIPPWLPNSETSGWLVPNADPDANAPPGLYTYTISFELEGEVDAETVTLIGRWATDNSGIDVVVNGTPTGLTGGGFTAWTEFPENAGLGLFVDGENTVEFLVDNAPPNDNPTGLRVEAFVGVPVPEERNLDISTGFDGSAGAVIGDDQPDPDYTLRGPGIDGEIAARSVPADEFPDFSLWLANSVNSRWISTGASDANAAPGEYTYAVDVDLPAGVDASLAALSGGVATDDELLDVLVNGVSTEFTGFGPETLQPFPVATGQGLFRAGTNRIEFLVNNIESGPTGLRVDGEVVEAPPPVDPEPSLFSIDTGYDNDADAILAGGELDDHWTVLGPPGSGLLGFATVVSEASGLLGPIGPWQAPSERATWISTPDIGANGPPGDYTFRVLVELPDGIDARAAKLIGRWTSDNTSFDVLVNGASTGLPGPSGNFPAFEQIPPDTGLGLFENGVNSIDIVVNNAGEQPNPVGLIVEAIVGTGDADPSSLSTGISTRGVGALPAGLDDEVWSVAGPGIDTARPAVVVGSPGAGWSANSGNSQWVGLDGADSDGVSGVYTYSAEFAVPSGLNPARVVLEGGWAAAASGIAARLNGVDLELTADGPASLTPFPDATGLGEMTSGVNVLEIDVRADSPTALRVEARLVSFTRPNPLDISTGFDEVSGTVLSDGEDDDTWSVTAPELPEESGVTIASVEVPAAWVPNSETSRWIGPFSSQIAALGNFSYRATVNLSEEEAEAAVIRGVIAADCSVVNLFINEQSTLFLTTGGFTDYTEFPPNFGAGLFVEGDNEIEVIVFNGGAAPNPAGLRVDAFVGTGGAPPMPRRRFLRGDSTADGVLNLTDAVRIFGFLFLGDAPATCSETMDANNDGRIILTDGVFVLNFLFQGGPPPSAPHPGCGFDPDAVGSAGDIGCEAYAPCA